MFRFRPSVLCGLILVAMPAAAQQGYQYSSTSTSDGVSSTSVMSVWGKYLRMDYTQGDQMEGMASFDGDVMIVSDGTQYYELTREMAEQLAGMMAGVGGMMEQAMAQARENMSEEDLERMKAMGIPGLGGDAKEAPPESRRVGSGGKDSTPLGPCTIERYEFPDGTPDQELCVADDEIAGFDELKFAFGGFMDFFSTIRDAMANGGMASFPGLQQNAMDRMTEMERLPLKGKAYVGGKLVADWVMTDARRADLDADHFGPPEGLPKADMPIGR